MDIGLAKNALTNDGIPKGFRRYCTAIVEDNLAQYYLDVFRERRALPEGIDRPYDPTDFTLRKCNANFIIDTSLTLMAVIEDGIITNPWVIRMVEIYKTRTWNYERGSKGSPESLTSKGEIEIIDLTLDAAIKSIERDLAAKR